MPRDWVEACAGPSNRKFKTATGEIIEDEGLGVLEGISESGGPMRFAGRRAAVGKPLAAASEMLKGRIGLMDESAGMVIEKNSEAGHAIMKFVTDLKEKGLLEDDIVLHQERIVCNVYMKVPAAKAEELKAMPVHAFQEEPSQEEETRASIGASSSGLSPSGGRRRV